MSIDSGGLLALTGLALLFIGILPGTGRGEGERAGIHCPGAPSKDPSARLSALVVCGEEETEGDDCRPYAGKENLRLKESSRMNLSVQRATIEKIRENDDLVLWIELDETGKCWFHKLTAEHIGDRLALVYNGKILIAPVVREAIPSGEIHLTQVYGTTAKEWVALCRGIASNCSVSILWRDRLRNFLKGL